MFLKADKGNVTVAANKTDYISNTERILNNHFLYQKINSDLVPTVEKKFNDIVGRWEKKAYINDQMVYRLNTRGSIGAKAYALPKIYKPILKWRLIVSTIGSLTVSNL